MPSPVAVGAVALMALRPGPVVIANVSPASMPTQNGWRWCGKCQGLFYSGHSSQGACPAGGQHDGSNSGRYELIFGDNVPGAQNLWRWCRKCEGLFYSGRPSQGSCAARGSHDGSQSGHYSLLCGDSTPATQGGWRWCQKCEGLFYSRNPDAGRCPAGGGHDGSRSGPYGASWERPAVAAAPSVQPVHLTLNHLPNVATVNPAVIHLVNPSIVLPDRTGGQPRNAFDLPTLIATASPPSDGMLLEAPRDPSRKFFAPHYAICECARSGTPTAVGRAGADRQRLQVDCASSRGHVRFASLWQYATCAFCRSVSNRRKFAGAKRQLGLDCGALSARERPHAES